MRSPAARTTTEDPRPLPLRADRAYVAYTLDFFRRWVRFYDLFAASIFWAYDALVRQLEPGPTTTILDLCAGTGEVSLRCARRGAAVTGVDLSPHMLQRARRKATRRRVTLALCRGDARNLPFADRSFQVVTLAFALHDMPRRIRIEVLREAARLAADRLLVLDYDLPRQPTGHRLARGAIALFESPYFGSFVDEDTVRLFADAGLPFEGLSRRRLGLFSLFEIPTAATAQQRRPSESPSGQDVRPTQRVEATTSRAARPIS